MLARSLLPSASFIARGRPVFSVTSEVAASASLQVAPPKPAPPDRTVKAGDDVAQLTAPPDGNTPATTIIAAVTAAIIVAPAPLATEAGPAASTFTAPLTIAAAGIAASNSTTAVIAAQAAQTQEAVATT